MRRRQRKTYHCPTTGITKLSDANDAGTRGSATCTLILTEGDSAKSLAMSGLSVVGHDRWGVFPLRWARPGPSLGAGSAPADGAEQLVVHGVCNGARRRKLPKGSWRGRYMPDCTPCAVPPLLTTLYYTLPLPRGKLLNVRDATAGQISENVEIQHIKQVRPHRAAPAPATTRPCLLPWPSAHPPALAGAAAIRPRPLLTETRRHCCAVSPPAQVLGLQHGKQYEDAKALRYGSLMIMTDQVRAHALLAFSVLAFSASSVPEDVPSAPAPAPNSRQ